MTTLASSPKQEIKRLISVLLAALLLACLAVGHMIYHYGPSGQHVLKNVLLDPEIMPDLVYRETQANGEAGPRMRFYGIQFIYQESKSKEWVQRDVSLERYAEWYQSVRDEKSIKEVTADLQEQFLGGDSWSLVLLVRPEGSKGRGSAPKQFQAVTFGRSGQDFRVDLHVDGGEQVWAYFHRPKIMEQAKKIFGEK